MFVPLKVLIAVSPHVDNAGESLSSLRFGARASLVENSASENVAENVRSTVSLRVQGPKSYGFRAQIPFILQYIFESQIPIFSLLRLLGLAWPTDPILESTIIAFLPFLKSTTPHLGPSRPHIMSTVRSQAHKHAGPRVSEFEAVGQLQALNPKPLQETPMLPDSGHNSILRCITSKSLSLCKTPGSMSMLFGCDSPYSPYNPTQWYMT